MGGSGAVTKIQGAVRIVSRAGRGDEYRWRRDERRGHRGTVTVVDRGAKYFVVNPKTSAAAAILCRAREEISAGRGGSREEDASEKVNTARNVEGEVPGVDDRETRG